MKKTSLYLMKILILVATVPLWFVKMFEGVGHLFNPETGGVVDVVFQHSMLENISDGWNPVFAYGSMAVTLAAVVLNVAVLKASNSERLRTSSSIMFWVAAGLFVLLLLLASAVGRGY